MALRAIYILFEIPLFLTHPVDKVSLYYGELNWRKSDAKAENKKNKTFDASDMYRVSQKKLGSQKVCILLWGP